MHSLRTSVVAAASLLVARLFRLPQSYWAPITTLVITQSSLGAALAVSWQRFVGTAMGALLGGIVAAYFGASVPVFAVCVFLLGLLCAVARSEWSAYRFGGVAVAIVLLSHERRRCGSSLFTVLRRFPSELWLRCYLRGFGRKESRSHKNYELHFLQKRMYRAYFGMSR
ncbi:MAG: FUSC family protein [Candidatus Sulfotelmatobacter sp.]